MKRILLVLLLMTCSVSWAEWELTDTSTDETVTFYHDKSTIRRNGSIVKMWTLRNYTTVQIDKQGKKYQSEVAHMVFNCKLEESVLISLTQYSAQLGAGSPIWSGTLKEGEWEWRPNVPRTIGETEWKLACGKK